MTGEFDDEEEEEEGSWGGAEDEGDEDDEGGQYFILQESTGYMAPTLTFLAVFHTIISFLCVVGYYYLKVYTHYTCSLYKLDYKYIKAVQQGCAFNILLLSL